MSSPNERGEKYFPGKQCDECMNCGTLLEYTYYDNDECSCLEDDDDC